MAAVDGGAPSRALGRDWRHCRSFRHLLWLDHLQADQKNKVFVFELAGLSALMRVYIYHSTRKKLHRYAQSVFYIHYINHIYAITLLKSADIRALI